MREIGRYWSGKASEIDLEMRMIKDFDRNGSNSGKLTK